MFLKIIWSQNEYFGALSGPSDEHTTDSLFKFKLKISKKIYHLFWGAYLSCGPGAATTSTPCLIRPTFLTDRKSLNALIIIIKLHDE